MATADISAKKLSAEIERSISALRASREKSVSSACARLIERAAAPGAMIWRRKKALSLEESLRIFETRAADEDLQEVFDRARALFVVEENKLKKMLALVSMCDIVRIDEEEATLLMKF